MGDIVQFPAGASLPDDEEMMDLEDMDLDELTAEELEDLQEQIESLYHILLHQEPEDEESEEYLEWEEKVEFLDDMMDEIQDRLDEE